MKDRQYVQTQNAFTFMSQDPKYDEKYIQF